MNCKPGDLAVTVRAKLVENIGCFCEVLGASGIPDYEWSIRFQSPKLLLLRDESGTEIGRECLCPDAWLRPIRDPGEEARDETLEWLPVPAKETA